MKLSGNKKGARYAGGAARGTALPKNRQTAGRAEQTEDPKVLRATMKKKRAQRTRRIAGSVLLIMIAISAVLYGIYKVGVRPPDTKPRTTVTAGSEGGDSQTATIAPAAQNDRISKYDYTFVIVGEDRVSKSTDTIMVANFDAANHTLNVVSIPRDTLVNVKWNTKKVNTLYANGGMDAVIDGLSKILGFFGGPLCPIDLEAFKKLVDAVDGVKFDVPKDMDYDDLCRISIST
jgi:anionic cell wall polymer biosynthesis LytR-Cps2A-Psr (LCP) family protein